MLRDLVDLGRRLREDGLIPPPGFADYSAPIRWTLTVRPGPNGYHFGLIGTESGERPRPDSGRTSGVFAYPLVDTAAYVLGVAEREDGKPDNNAPEKHQAFLGRLDRTAHAVEDIALRDVLSALRDVLEREQIPIPEEVRADHWVAVEATAGPLAGAPLYEHPEVRRLWQEEVAASVVREGDHGTCSVTGEDGPLVFRVPGKGYFQRGRASLLGLDADAYVSYRGGGAVSDKAHIGLSFDAADLANRSLEYLSRSALHQRTLVYDKDSDLRTVTSVFWMSTDEPVVTGSGTDVRVLAPADLLAALHAGVGSFGKERDAPAADLGRVRDLLRLPWSMQRPDLRISDVGVHFAVLSKNAYRVVVRDYRTESLADVRTHLRQFLDAAALVAPGGRSVPVSLHAMLEAAYGIVDDQGNTRATTTKSTNYARALHRTAYFGAAPPRAVLDPALARIRTLMTKEGDTRRGFRLHALLSLVKLALTHNTPDAMTLERLDEGRDERAYLCGRLLAVLGRIQQDALTDDNNPAQRGRQEGEGQVLNRTLTERYFAAASLAPSAYFGTLVQRATTAHLPKLPPRREKGVKDYRKTQAWAQEHLDTLLSRIHEHGGFPHTLSLAGQGEFALGYYHQRAQFFVGASASGSTPDAPAGGTDTPTGDAPSDLFTQPAQTDA